MLYAIVRRNRRSNKVKICKTNDENGLRVTEDKRMAESDCQLLNSLFRDSHEYLVIEFQGD